MTVWLPAAPAFLAALVWAVGPGLLIGAVARLRGSTLVGVAPLVSMSVLALSALAASLLGLRWDIAFVGAGIAIAALIAGALAWALRRHWPGTSDERPSRALWLMAGIAVGALLIVPRLLVVFGEPWHLSQTFDNVFHLNAVRYILDTGDASPLTIGTISHAFTGQGAFYPDLWHILTALVAQTTGTAIPVAANAVNLVIGGVLWPLGVTYLVRQLVGPSRVSMLVSGVISASFAAFPLLMVEFGVLYPNLLSIALLPACLGAAVVAFGNATASQYRARVGAVALVAGLPGMAIAHPSTPVAFLFFASPLAVVAFVRRWRRLRVEGAPRRRRALLVVIVCLAALAALAAFAVLRPPKDAAFWGPTQGLGGALWSALTNSEMSRPADLVLTVLAAVGVVALFVVGRHRWLAFALGAALGLYVAAAWLWQGNVRYVVVGTWYSDVNRLVALVPVVMAPVAAYGVVWLGRWLARSVREGRRRVLEGGISLVLVALAGSLIQVGPALSQATALAAAKYELTDSSPLLSRDEYLLLERLPDEVPEDTVVAGNPWTGASLVYAISDRRALLPHIFGDRSKSVETIMSWLRDAGRGSLVCRLIADLDIGYVLDFGAREVHGGDHPIPGFEDLSTSDAVTLVDREGSAGLYEVTACSGGRAQ